MDLWALVAATLVAVLAVAAWAIQGRRSRHLPPGPPSWPLIGSLLACKPPLHESFAKLARRYGPVVFLKLGTVNTVIVSSAAMAREVLKTRDVEFAHRPRTAMFELLSFNYNGLIGAAYGDPWKQIRRISTIHLFSPSKLALSDKIRRREIHAMVAKIADKMVDSNSSSSSGDLERSYEVNVTALLHQTVINAAFNLLFGRRHYDGGSGEEHDQTSFVKLFLKNVLDEGFKFSVGDFFPALRFLDGETRLGKELVPRITQFIQDLIRESRKEGGDRDRDRQDFVDVLTRLQGADALPDIRIVALLADLLVGGTSTSEAAIDYAMAEMLRQPRILAKAQAEIDRVVGRDRLVDESDAPALPYLQSIVKETLRLHPGAPVGLPHHNPSAARIGDYDIPAGSTIFVNLWAIGRDPSSWDRAEEFLPERFDSVDVSPLGHDFELIPFGAGRRICVGYPLAMRFIPFALATLLQAFDWSPAPGTTAADIDMSDTIGAGLHRAKDLVASAAPRLSHEVYATLER